jgi:hypothetical protein
LADACLYLFFNSYITIKTYFHDLFFPYAQVMTQPSGTNLCTYYVCKYMHRVIACADGGKFEEKARVHTTATTCCSYLFIFSDLVLILLFIFFTRFPTSRKHSS